MKKVVIQIADSEILTYLPEAWNECNQAQALSAFALLTQPVTAVFSPQEEIPFRKQLLLQTLALDKEGNNFLTDKFLQAWQLERCEEHGDEDGNNIFFNELQILLDCFNGFFSRTEDEDTGEVQYSIAHGFTEFPFHFVQAMAGKLEPKSKRTRLIGLGANKKRTSPRPKLYAPSDSFKGMPFMELVAAFVLFSNYLRDPNGEKTANTLLAALFRPLKPKSAKEIADIDPAHRGNVRVPFNGYESMIARRADMMQRVPAQLRQLAIFWISCCLESIVQRYEGLFTAAEGNGGGWGELMTNLAGSAKLKDWDDVADNPYENVFAFLIAEKNKADAIREQQRKNSLK